MKSKYLLAWFLLIQIVFLKIIAYFPKWVEHYYSNGIYIYISKSLRWLLGCLPISIGDIIYGLAIGYGLTVLWKNRKGFCSSWKERFWKQINVVSVVYCLFHLLWAMNYYREPLFDKMKLTREYTKQDLVDFTKILIVKTNALQLQITKDSTAKVVNPYTQEQLFAMTQLGYDQLAKEYPYFRYNLPSIKKSLFSAPLSYMGFSGYLNPFTNEAQVNYQVPQYGFPVIITHEMAHQMGYASESECNFIGFMAALKNKDAYFQYAAYTMAVKYCMGALGAMDKDLFLNYKKQLHSGILKNFEEDHLFWKAHETFIEDGFHTFYDQFLKMNQQEDGMESYSKFVDLMINYNKSKAIL